MVPNRIHYPEDASIWVDVRPITGKDVALVQRRAKSDPDSGEIDWTILALSRCITAWSFEEEISEDTIGDLPLEQLNWLMEGIDWRGSGRSEPEKKASNGRSSAGLRRATSPTSLAS